MATVPTPESADWMIHINSAVFISLLIAFYNFGIWSRTYIFPADAANPLKVQLLAGIPVGFMLMGFYGKTAYASIDAKSANLLFDSAVIVANMIVFGMLSRETLDKMIDEGRERLRRPDPPGD
jgi:hypothetical protein